MPNIDNHNKLLTVDRVYNFIIGTGFSVNLLSSIKLIQFNQAITVVTGLGAAVLVVVQIINKYEAFKNKKLQNKDMELHLKKEELELSRLRDEKKKRRFKYKSNVSKTSK